jgi:hypothetical protein
MFSLDRMVDRYHRLYASLLPARTAPVASPAGKSGGQPNA